MVDGVRCVRAPRDGRRTGARSVPAPYSATLRRAVVCWQAALRFLVPYWYITACTGGTYAGVAYFVSAYPSIVFRYRTKFTDRADKIGSFVGGLEANLGVFAFIFYLNISTGLMVAAIVWYVGAAAFILFSTRVRHEVGT